MDLPHLGSRFLLSIAQKVVVFHTWVFIIYRAKPDAGPNCDNLRYGGVYHME